MQPGRYYNLVMFLNLIHVVYAGEVMIQSGDTSKGIEAFERAVQLAPNDENLLLSAAHRLR